MTFTKFRLSVPKGWKLQRLQTYETERGVNYRVDVPGACKGKKDGFDSQAKTHSYITRCPGFAVLGESYITPGPRASRSGYALKSPFHPGTDPSHFCPSDPDKYNGVKWTSDMRPTVRRLAQVGPRQAEYREWRLECMDYANRYKTTAKHTQRIWFLPQSKIVIVDEWGVPGLEKVLAAANWL